MIRSAVLAIGLSACAGAPPAHVYRPDVVSIVDSDSDKAVQIVSDERIAEHEPRAVPTSAVAAALIASGMFLDDDARTLAEPIAKHLPTMETDEAVRIVGWAADAPRYYYIVIHKGRLQIVYYAGSHRTDDYSAVIPTEAKPIEAPKVAPPPVPETPTPTPPPPPPPAPPDAGADAIAKAPPPGPKPRVHRPAPPAYQPITEAEARRQLRELDEAMQAGLISEVEHRTKRKEILARL